MEISQNTFVRVDLLLEVSRQKIFARDFAHRGKMIHFLVGFQRRDDIHGDQCIIPDHVTSEVRLGTHREAEHIRCLTNYRINIFTEINVRSLNNAYQQRISFRTRWQ
jgi:hypothetical protein